MKKLILVFLVLITASGVYAKDNTVYENYINDAFENGLIHGNQNGDFESGKLATRAEFITMTTKFFDLKPGYFEFSDVGEKDWFYESMSIAGANGIIAGYDDGTARPQGLITCQEAVTIVGRYYKLTEDSYEVKGVYKYAQPYYSYAVKKKLFVEMTPEYTNPAHYMTKGELLVLLYKYHNENLNTIRFLSGYPKISENGNFGNVTVSIKTNRPCKVYYGVYPENGNHTAEDTLLCQVPYGNTEVTSSIPLNMNQKYDIYFRAVLDSGEASRGVSLNLLRHLHF